VHQWGLASGLIATINKRMRVIRRFLKPGNKLLSLVLGILIGLFCSFTMLRQRHCNPDYKLPIETPVLALATSVAKIDTGVLLFYGSRILSLTKNHPQFSFWQYTDKLICIFLNSTF
jgi:hypothetical protein